MARACTELEKAFGLAADNHIPRAQARPTVAINMERAGDMESLIGWIQRNCLTEMKEAGNWDAFGKVLAEHGLSLKARGNGLVFMSGKVHVKASSVDRSLSKTNLEKRFGSVLAVSAKTGAGMAALCEAIGALYPTGAEPQGELLTNARQADAVRRALSCVKNAHASLQFGMTPDVVLTDAEGALEALGELNGKHIREDLVDTIFSRFCVGK